MKLFSRYRTKAPHAPAVSAIAPPALRKLGKVFSQSSSSISVGQTSEGNKTYRDLLSRLQIPINAETPDQIESAQVRDRGQFLARQERWEELEDLIRTHDQNRAATATGTPLAELMLFGARSDVVRAAEHALLHGRPAEDADFFAGIEAMEYLLEEYPDSYPIALVVAHMHIDVGWAWRGASAKEDVREINREAFEAHFERATNILKRFCPKEHHSPALSAARCALLPGEAQPLNTLCREFESLIALDPFNPRHMRALGNYLLPRWYGDFPQLDLQARRIAAQTYDVWGAGAYAWVWFDALLVDPSGLETLEIEYFVDGVTDALQRSGDQHSANLMAAHLYRCWQHARAQHSADGLRADLPPALRQGFEMVVRDHLREIHPLIWGHAEIGFENTSRVISKERLSAKGRDIALQAVAMPFMSGLQAGQTVYFTPEGITQVNP
ncbi:hypothetical protein J7382_07880 [Shimia sp. R11_0]|uniref:hypothetical protein n=1 Tax=Shimia sp. R11_0 TaxID=2821096 RepID=UPI001ADBDA31|nr:hypothetical protein [Shimia sp. R11_0]MBO9477450.1 hypothetical protein [Shimia sp. R11_0]